MHLFENVRPTLRRTDMNLDGRGTSRAKTRLKYTRVLLDAGTRLEQKGGSDFSSETPCC